MALNDVLKTLEAVEANVEKLARLWDEIRPMLPSVGRGTISGVSDEDRYRDRARVFEHIVKHLPAIDGHNLAYCLMDSDVILSTCIDLAELDEITATISYDREVFRQGELLDEYRFRLGLKRRQLIRQSVPDFIEQMEALLKRIQPTAKELANNADMASEEWEQLRHTFKAIGALVGSGFERTRAWHNLSRHLHFGLRCDYDDIIQDDWPAVKSALQQQIYSEDDPLPVDTKDLGELIASNPKGDVVTELQWSRLRPEDFERLLFNLISGTSGYENPTWLTHTNAPDDGRDLAVYQVQPDKLVGVLRHRVIIACKHWTSKSVDLPQITTLKAQMSLWEPPRVDCLIVATSGRLTTQAVRWVDNHNQSDSALRIDMWPGTHFEWLLAQRPALIAEFGLR
jgi:hypothetical protein